MRLPFARSLPFAVALALTVLASPGARAATPLPTYRPENAAIAGSLPIHVVFHGAKLRPQIAAAPSPMVPVERYALEGPFERRLPSKVPLNPIAAGVVAGWAGAADRILAVDFTRPPYARVQQAGCDRPYTRALGDAIVARLHAAWPDATITIHVLDKDQKIDDVVDDQAPRYVFDVTASIGAYFTGVAAVIDADAYPAQAGAARATARPAWHDTLVTMSDRLELPPKTQADIERLVAAENARFEAMNLGPTIARLDAEGITSRNKRERAQVGEQIAAHRKALLDAQRAAWSPYTAVVRRAELLSENQCARMDAALATTVGTTERMLDAMLTGTLPTPPGSKDPPAPETPGVRSIVALADGTMVSRVGGDTRTLWYLRTLLPE